METLKFALPDHLEPEETVKRLKEEYHFIVDFRKDLLTWDTDIEIWACDTSKQDGVYNYMAKASTTWSFFYLGMAVSRILE